MLNNIGPHVEKIYLAWSELPYSDYNPAARGRYRNSTPKNLYLNSRYANKVELVEGRWNDETSQRNELVDIAKSNGFDVMIIQDADEFVSSEDFKKNLKYIETNPGINAFCIPWYIYWRKTHIRIHESSRVHIGTSECYAMRLVEGSGFRNRRISNLDHSHKLPGMCHHLAYVYSDDGMKEKLDTWSHSCDLNIERWYELKWYYWSPKTIFLHPLWPDGWFCAKEVHDVIPKEMQEVENPQFTARKMPIWVRIRELVYNSKYWIKWISRPLRASLRKVILQMTRRAV
jgi:hypothetical protein